MRLAKTLGTSARTAQRFGATSHELVDLELRSQLAGRWRMATMQIVFAVIPALVYLAAGLPATAGAMTIGTLVAFTALHSISTDKEGNVYVAEVDAECFKKFPARRRSYRDADRQVG